MKEIHKEYDRSFLLDPTKLTRLLEKIHERLDEHPHATRRDHFEAFLAGNRREEMASIDDVLALENSRKHRIQRLLIVCSAATQGVVRPEHEVQVDFGGLKTRSPNDTSTKKVVAVSVRSDVTGWASRTLSEVEEQVERTWLPYAQPVAALIAAPALVLIVGAQFLSVRFERPTFDLLRVMWLGDPGLDRVQQMLNDLHNAASEYCPRSETEATAGEASQSPIGTSGSASSDRTRLPRDFTLQLSTRRILVG